MVSLKQHIHLSACQSMLASVYAAWSSLLDNSGAHAPDSIDPAAAERLRKRLERVREHSGPAVESGANAAVDRCAADAAEAVDYYYESIAAAYDRVRRELENTSKALDDVLISVAAQDGAERIDVDREFRELEDLLEVPDPQILKSGLQAGLHRLRARFDDLRREKDSVIAMLRDEVRTLQKNIEHATSQPGAQCAQLTREEFESFVEGQIEQGASFCLVYGSLANLSRLRRFQGSAAVTAAVDLFAGLLRQFLPNCPAITRFGVGAFCCLVPASAKQTTTHIGQLTRMLGDPSKAGTPLPHFTTVSFMPTDGPERLLRRFHDLQRRAVHQE